MQKYNVRVYLSTYFDTEVEAENEQQARETAEDSENWDREQIECNLNVQPCETEIEDEDEDTDEDVNETAPQPLFSDEAIEGLHVGGNNLAIGFMHVENEADLAKAKEYLRGLNRRHLAGLPITGPSPEDALARLADVVKRRGEVEKNGTVKLNTWDASFDGGAMLQGSNIDTVMLFPDGKMRIYFSLSENNYMPAENFDADDLSNFADDLEEYFAA